MSGPGILMPDGRRIHLKEWAFVTRSQIAAPPPRPTVGRWQPLILEMEAQIAAYRSFRKRTRRQSRWYRRNQAAIEERRRREPRYNLGKNIDFARLYPHGRHRILASREVW